MCVRHNVGTSTLKAVHQCILGLSKSKYLYIMCVRPNFGTSTLKTVRKCILGLSKSKYFIYNVCTP